MTTQIYKKHLLTTLATLMITYPASRAMAMEQFFQEFYQSNQDSLPQLPQNQPATNLPPAQHNSSLSSDEFLRATQNLPTRQQMQTQIQLSQQELQKKIKQSRQEIEENIKQVQKTADACSSKVQSDMRQIQDHGKRIKKIEDQLNNNTKQKQTKDKQRYKIRIQNQEQTVDANQLIQYIKNVIPHAQTKTVIQTQLNLITKDIGEIFAIAESIDPFTEQPPPQPQPNADLSEQAKYKQEMLDWFNIKKQHAQQVIDDNPTEFFTTFQDLEQEEQQLKSITTFEEIDEMLQQVKHPKTREQIIQLINLRQEQIAVQAVSEQYEMKNKVRNLERQIHKMQKRYDEYWEIVTQQLNKHNITLKLDS